ncbi:MAG: 3-dehydroquinate synthase [Candidatus Aureabacteria bacterium]|nr:3-dehydroquinate synthase [Candidatus Auribacterota bacterium]
MKQEKIIVKLGKDSYPVSIGMGLIGDIGAAVGNILQGSTVAIVTNDVVAPLYLEKVRSSLKQSGFRVVTVIIPDGEEQKSIETAKRICEELLKNNIDRTHSLLALGGGVIGDLTGFAASIYMRGIPFIQVPTTLLAQVDASIGGKTAVNLPAGKNLIGTFYQPKAVFIDVDVLDSLKEEVFTEGMSEIIKHGIIKDRNYFGFLEGNLKGILSKDKNLLVKMISVSCRIKADIVSKDEKESGLRAILNYGHTVAHAVESLSSYKSVLHGQAVSIGMSVAGRIAVLKGIFPEKELEKQNKLLQDAGLPVSQSRFAADDIIKALKSDKKVRDGKVRFVLPVRIGKVTIDDDIDDALISKAVNSVFI